MNYSLIIWDFDGTLANTMALALATYNELAARHGFRQVDDPALIRGLSTRTFLKEHGISLIRLPFLIKEYLTATRSRMKDVRLFDGLPDLLRSLKTGGYRQGIFSSNSADNIRACLAANEVEDIFEFVVGYPRLFGKAKGIQRVLKKERVEPESVLYIGDEDRDLKAAKKAGVDSAAVGWGFQSKEFLAQQAPTFIWPSPKDVRVSLLPPQ